MSLRANPVQRLSARRKQDPMSAPNKSYDPRAVAALAPDEVARALDEALAAVAAAGTLDELKAARIAHDGDRAPLSLANAEIGALPPQARAEAGRRVGAARGRLHASLQERQAQLEADRDQQVLVTEAVDVTLPGGRDPAGRAPPGHDAGRPAVRRVRRDGLRSRGRTRGRGRVVQLRRAEHPARSPGQGNAGHDLHRQSGGTRCQVRPGAADAHLAGADQVHAHPAAAALRGQPRPLLPVRAGRRHA